MPLQLTKTCRVCVCQYFFLNNQFEMCKTSPVYFSKRSEKITDRKYHNFGPFKKHYLIICK
jgi:hypothetical protein